MKLPIKNETERLFYNLSCNSISVRVQRQIRTSRLIETLRFFSFVSVSNKPFACAVFGIHRVKVLLCDHVFSLSAAHFLCQNCPKISISIKKWNRKILPRLFVSIVYPFVSKVRHFVSKVWLYTLNEKDLQGNKSSQVIDKILLFTVNMIAFLTSVCQYHN